MRDGGGRYLRNCSPELRMNWRSSFIVGMRAWMVEGGD